MPEGPSLVILREQARVFEGRRILRVEGNTTIDTGRLKGRTVQAVRTWGKHFLLELPTVALRIHLLMFGSYCIDERKEEKVPRLSLRLARKHEFNFYSCSVKFIEVPLDEAYDWAADVMADEWDPKLARKRLKAMPDTIVADALLEQDVFAGVGNIIKNEVLFRIRVHPESTIGALPPRKLGELIKQARDYSFDFLAWKQAFVLKKHYQVHTKTICPRDGNRLTYRKHLGRAQRRAFFCEVCQKRYPPEA